MDFVIVRLQKEGTVKPTRGREVLPPGLSAALWSKYYAY